jgi:O-antigen/teichoic acid export membrane protein
MGLSVWRKQFSEVTNGSGLKYHLMRGVLGIGGMKLLSMPLTLAASILLARALGPEGYGKYAFVLAVIGVLVLPIGPGIGQLITREVASYYSYGNFSLLRGFLKRALQWVLLGSSLLIGTLTIIFVPFVSWALDDRWTLLLIGSLIYPWMGLNGLRVNTMRGLHITVKGQIPDLIVQPGLHLLLSGLLLLFGVLTPASALSSQLASTAVAVGLGGWLLFKYMPINLRTASPAFENVKWANSILPFTALTGAGLLNSQIGLLILGGTNDQEGVAALQLAQSGALLVTFSLTVIEMVVAPEMARAFSEGDLQRLQKLLRYSARIALLLGLPIAILLVFCGGSIVDIVYGELYVDVVAVPLAILAIGYLINVILGSAGLLLTMCGYERDTLALQLLSLSLNLFLSLTLIPEYGAVGAAYSVSISLVLRNTLMAKKVYQRLAVKPTALL